MKFPWSLDYVTHFWKKHAPIRPFRWCTCSICLKFIFEDFFKNWVKVEFCSPDFRNVGLMRLFFMIHQKLVWTQKTTRGTKKTLESRWFLGGFMCMGDTLDVTFDALLLFSFSQAFEPETGKETCCNTYFKKIATEILSSSTVASSKNGAWPLTKETFCRLPLPHPSVKLVRLRFVFGFSRVSIYGGYLL